MDEDAVVGVERLARLPRGCIEAAVDRLGELEEQLTRNVNTKFLVDGLVIDVGAALAPGGSSPP